MIVCSLHYLVPLIIATLSLIAATHQNGYETASHNDMITCVLVVMQITQYVTDRFAAAGSEKGTKTMASRTMLGFPAELPWKVCVPCFGTGGKGTSSAATIAVPCILHMQCALIMNHGLQTSCHYMLHMHGVPEYCNNPNSSLDWNICTISCDTRE